MDYFLYIIGGLLVITGLLGCVIPGLPGPPLNFLALILVQFSRLKPFSPGFLWLWAGITLVVTVLDYIIPVLGSKKFGASRWGIIGSFAGIIAGFFFFPPFGIIIGPIAGAITGELIAGKDTANAIRAGLGSFTGFVFSTLLKLVISGIMAYYFIQAFFHG